MGLLKTAVRAGVASSVHGRVQRRQQQRWAQEDQRVAQTHHAAAQQAVPQPAPAAPAAPAPAAAPVSDTTDMLAQLTKLGELRDAGVLTEAEFEVQKARILGT
ncbi:MAG: SHOCT domain-containing protein [Microthrixaceae bacterium]|nr:SHOCT domain-containing protein [Microthrixaceae bacterium]